MVSDEVLALVRVGRKIEQLADTRAARRLDELPTPVTAPAIPQARRSVVDVAHVVREDLAIHGLSWSNRARSQAGQNRYEQDTPYHGPGLVAGKGDGVAHIMGRVVQNVRLGKGDAEQKERAQ